VEEENLQLLIDKYNSGLANADEEAIVESWYERINGGEPQVSAEELARIKKDTYGQLLDYISGQSLRPAAITRKYPFAKGSWAAAAAILVICSCGLFFYFNKPDVRSVRENALKEVVPGGDRAILTLSDGSSVDLSAGNNGKVAVQGNTTVSKERTGLLAYARDERNAAATTVYNTLSTPRGGRYTVILQDGTKVWLNAASSIRFPTEFTAGQRKVEIKGEAYFEVAKNKSKPFVVASADQQVEVLGTHFNINSYEDEANVRTTLLEGMIRVKHEKQTAILRPGQQSVIDNNNPLAIHVVKDADTEAVMAWQNGRFNFEDEDIKSVMRQLSRWYDVDVAYKHNNHAEHFSGTFPRSMKLQDVLRVIAFTGVKFKIEGRTVIIQ
jgi:transmembrane sensor